jgi:hypothetical protein
LETTTMRVVYLSLFCGLSLAASGCGGGIPDVGGKVVLDGQPYSLKPGEGITVNLTSEDGKTTCTGKVEQDGTFKLKGQDGGSVPAGRYKVGFTHYPPPPADPTKGAAPPTNKATKEVWEVSASNKEFTLDISPKKQ